MDRVLEMPPVVRRSEQAEQEIFVINWSTQIDLVPDLLVGSDFVVREAANVPECLDLIADVVPSAVVVVLDRDADAELLVIRTLRQALGRIPIVVTSLSPSIDQAVTAMRNGAADFIDLLSAASTLSARLRVALENAVEAPLKDWRSRLTARECEVVALVTTGASNKEVGRQLGISPRTVEVHRARIMEKLNARNAADLVRIVLSSSA